MDDVEIPPLSKPAASHAIPAPRFSRPLHPVPTRWTLSLNEPTSQPTYGSTKRITAIRFASPTKRSVEELNANPKLTPVHDIRPLEVYPIAPSSATNAPHSESTSPRWNCSPPHDHGSPSRKAFSSAKKYPMTLRRSQSDLKINVKLAPDQGPIKPLNVRRRSDSSPPSILTRSCSHPEVSGSPTRERRVVASGKENGSPLKKRVPF
jgi:hypothetical protein